MRFFNENNGLTLIELIVVMAIIGILFLALGSFLLVNIKLFNTSETQNEVQNQAQVAMDSITENLISTKGISLPSGTNPKFNGTSLFQSVTMQNWDDTEKVISYDEVNKQLKSTSNSITRVLAYNVSAFTIEPLSAKTPNTFSDCIGLRVILKVTIKEQTIDLTNEVYFRNKT